MPSLFSRILIILRFCVVGRVSSVFSGDYFNAFSLIVVLPKIPHLHCCVAVISGLGASNGLPSSILPSYSPFPEAAEANFIISTSDCDCTSAQMHQWLCVTQRPKRFRVGPTPAVPSKIILRAPLTCFLHPVCTRLPLSLSLGLPEEAVTPYLSIGP